MDTQLRTSSESLIPFEEKEIDLFLEINTEPGVRKFLWDDELIPRELAEEILKQNVSQFSNEKSGLWKIISEEEVAGYAGLWYFFDETQPQLIYALLPDYRGKGIATRTSNAIIEYAFSKLDFSYLLAAMDESHEDSMRVAERIGMKFVEKRMADNKPTIFYRIDR